MTDAHRLDCSNESCRRAAQRVGGLRHFYAARPHWVPVLISYAIGALLGAAFLEVLPHAIEAAGIPESGPR